MIKSGGEKDTGMRKAIPCVFLAAILLLYAILSTLRVLEQGGRSDWDEDNSATNQIQSELLKVHQLFLSINNTLQDILLQEENMPGRSWSEEDKEKRQLESSVPLYVITPTYPRMTQLSEITRIGQVLKVTGPLEKERKKKNPD